MRNLATIALLLSAATAWSGDPGVELSLRLETLITGQDVRNAAIDPMDHLLWAANMEHSMMLRGGQPGGAAAPVFLIRVAGGQPPEVIAAALDNGVRVQENVVTEIPWPWQPRTEDDTELSSALAVELGQRLSSRLAESPAE